VAVVFLLTKGKLALLFLLTKGKLLLGALKAGPLLTTVSTMALSMWAFAAYYGAALAVGIVLSILVHELGHGAAAKSVGLRVGAPVFIPLFGAVIALKEQPRSTWVEAIVGFGGPLGGTAAGLAALALAAASGPGYWRNLFFVVAWFTFLINLFNLMPVFGLDGDRVSRTFRRWHWVAGAALAVGILAAEREWTGRIDPLLVFVLALGLLRAGASWIRARRGAAPRRLLDRLHEGEKYVEESGVEPWQRHAAAAAYFLLAGALSILASMTHGATPAV
jgi:Zn-dependent protease